jgi:hypothetical protein
MFMALVSLLTERPVRSDTAMTSDPRCAVAFSQNMRQPEWIGLDGHQHIMSEKSLWP